MSDNPWAVITEGVCKQVVVDKLNGQRRRCYRKANGRYGYCKQHDVFRKKAKL